ncbi:hypothetical protein EDM00_07890 [Ornithobacterium rhinotracheale]|nr:hypothetical protein [Ornithobacterium rhinotracheale]
MILMGAVKGYYNFRVYFEDLGIIAYQVQFQLATRAYRALTGQQLGQQPKDKRFRIEHDYCLYPNDYPDEKIFPDMKNLKKNSFTPFTAEVYIDKSVFSKKDNDEKTFVEVLKNKLKSTGFDLSMDLNCAVQDCTLLTGGTFPQDSHLKLHFFGYSSKRPLKQEEFENGIETLLWGLMNSFGIKRLSIFYKENSRILEMKDSNDD